MLLDFPSVSAKDELTAEDLFLGNITDRKLVHVWYEEGKLVSYNGKVSKFRKGKAECKIACWLEDEECDDATDWEISVYGLDVDLSLGDLTIEYLN